jgi:hypothetical protein
VGVLSYSQASSVTVFGTLTGNRDADGVLRALADTRLTRTDISEIFLRNKTSRQLDEIITAVLATGLARHQRQTTGGRTRDTFYLIRRED